MWRLGASLLLAVVLAVVASGWLVDRVFDRVAPGETESMRLARALGGELARALDGGDGTATAPSTALDAQADIGRWPVQRLSREALPLPAPLARVLDAGEPLALESSDGVTLYFDMPRSGDVLSLALSEPRRAGLGMRLALTALFYGAVAALVLAWLYPLARRLRRLAAGARTFGEGALAARVPTNPFSNLRATEMEFNRMARRIERLIEDNRLLSGAVSHDLRTPLARLRFGLDALGETFETPVDASSRIPAGAPGGPSSRQRDYLSRLDADLARMERLVDVLLEFVRLDRQLHELPLDEVDLVPLIGEAVGIARDASAHRIEWEPPPEPCPVLADERYARMLLANLVQNATRHGRSTVRVSLVAESGPETVREVERVALRVDDDGPGIAAIEREAVLEPFVRGRDAADGSVTGFGLGLAIVARIAEWHDAPLSIGTAESLGGARVAVAFRTAVHRVTDSGSAS